MKFSTAFVLSTIFASASAFAPSKKAEIQRASALRMAESTPSQADWKGYYTNYDDAQVVKTDADMGFDPLGFSDTNAGLFFMREAEIKHARLAM